MFEYPFAMAAMAEVLSMKWITRRPGSWKYDPRGGKRKVTR
jgi:hypothetical protein